MAELESSESSTSLSLMDGLRGNRAGSWERFVEFYGPLFDFWFHRSRVPESDWNDLRQEMLIAVHRGLPTFIHSPGRGSFRGWLRVIAKHMLIDRGRRQSPVIIDPVALMQQADQAVSEHEVREEHRILYQQALDLIRTDFEAPTWRAFWLTAVEGKSAAQAATELGLTLNAVYLAKSRVLRRLREEFADFLDGQPPVN